MGEQQPSLPTMGPAPLVAGPIFLSFELRGPPHPKGRHRSAIRYKAGKPFIFNYPDPGTAAYEETLAEAAALFMRGKPPTPNPVALLVHAFKPIPVSYSKRDREWALAGRLLPTPKPDWDNYGKITDALNGIVWNDDSQICDGRVIKRYSDQPALRIEVREFISTHL